jgi:hypothetical protein
VIHEGLGQRATGGIIAVLPIENDGNLADLAE